MTLLYGPDGKPITDSISAADTPKPHKASEHQKGNRARRLLVACVLGAATIIGTFGVVIPRPVVTPSEPVDPQNSLSASFTVANTGYIPLWHVTGRIALGKLKTTNNITLLGTDFKSLINIPAWTDHNLYTDDGFTIVPDEIARRILPNKNFGEAEIEIVVSYQPWFIRWTRTRRFRFETYRQTNGNYYWYLVQPNRPK